jgi:hypothetical protein
VQQQGTAAADGVRDNGQAVPVRQHIDDAAAGVQAVFARLRARSGAANMLRGADLADRGPACAAAGWSALLAEPEDSSVGPATGQHGRKRQRQRTRIVLRAAGHAGRPIGVVSPHSQPSPQRQRVGEETSMAADDERLPAPVPSVQPPRPAWRETPLAHNVAARLRDGGCDNTAVEQVLRVVYDRNRLRWDAHAQVPDDSYTVPEGLWRAVETARLELANAHRRRAAAPARGLQQ